jgi:hypothetical protein
MRENIPLMTMLYVITEYVRGLHETIFDSFQLNKDRYQMLFLTRKLAREENVLDTN